MFDLYISIYIYIYTPLPLSLVSSLMQIGRLAQTHKAHRLHIQGLADIPRKFGKYFIKLTISSVCRLRD